MGDLKTGGRIRVFVSFASEDKEHAEGVARKLRRAGFVPVGFGLESAEPHNPRATESTGKLLDYAMRDSGALVLVQGPNTGLSPWVPAELSRAESLDLPVARWDVGQNPVTGDIPGPISALLAAAERAEPAPVEPLSSSYAGAEWFAGAYAPIEPDYSSALEGVVSKYKEYRGAEGVREAFDYYDRLTSGSTTMGFYEVTDEIYREAAAGLSATLATLAPSDRRVQAAAAWLPDSPDPASVVERLRKLLG